MNDLSCVPAFGKQVVHAGKVVAQAVHHFNVPAIGATAEIRAVVCRYFRLILPLGLAMKCTSYYDLMGWLTVTQLLSSFAVPCTLTS